MDQPTVAIYEQNAQEWARRRTAPMDDLGLQLRRRVGPGPILDAGCGVGRYFDQLGSPTMAIDVAAAMLAVCRRRIAEAHDAGGVSVLQGDLEALPFRQGSFEGVFARHSYLHLPPDRAPDAFAETARVLAPGGTLLVSMIAGTYAGRALRGDDFPGRWFTLWTAEALDGVLRTAGFSDVEVTVVEGRHAGCDVVATARRG